MTGWKYVHGKGDDPLGAPTYVESAYGVKFDPPVSQAEMGKMIGTLGASVRQYVEETVAANKKLKNANATLTKLMETVQTLSTAAAVLNRGLSAAKTELCNIEVAEIVDSLIDEVSKE